MINRSFAIAMLTFALVIAPGVASLEDTLTLKQIMQGLRDDYVKIADGLLTDDFDLVAAGASAIANHPKIPAQQVQLVAAELGQEMPSFKRLDMRVHDLSLDIRDAAEVADRDKALRSYQEMTEGCVACHSAYKKRVARALD